MTVERTLTEVVVVRDRRPIVRDAVTRALRARLPHHLVSAVSEGTGMVEVGCERRALEIDAYPSLDSLAEAVASATVGGDDVVAARRLSDAAGLALSPREAAVWSMVGHGLTAAGIGRELGISPRTVETHKRTIRSKLTTRGVA